MEVLRTAGITALQASDGLDAIARMRSGGPPCALLLDIDMPRLDGPGLVARLRQDGAFAAVPVITMTAGVVPPGLAAHGHLQKPFDVSRMLGCLFDACRACAICDGEGPVIGSVFTARRRADSGGAS